MFEQCSALKPYWYLADNTPKAVHLKQEESLETVSGEHTLNRGQSLYRQNASLITTKCVIVGAGKETLKILHKSKILCYTVLGGNSPADNH